MTTNGRLLTLLKPVEMDAERETAGLSHNIIIDVHVTIYGRCNTVAVQQGYTGRKSSLTHVVMESNVLVRGANATVSPRYDCTV